MVSNLNLGPAKSVKEASESLITAAFVRHPFHRLASVYNDKIGKRNTRFFPPIRKYIVENYRKPMDLMKSYISTYLESVLPILKIYVYSWQHCVLSDPMTGEWLPFPTPQEFAEYFVDEIPKMGDVLNPNRHYAAQYTQCPFCSLPFDVGT